MICESQISCPLFQIANLINIAFNTERRDREKKEKKKNKKTRSHTETLMMTPLVLLKRS
jgi:hypothetical protein